ncbi:MAG TPA: protein-L-isoaspartate(D-aspartate) O-methyltransferase [Chitinophagaceae bacterium]|nr:protein-L-isoaspartate(D-aspartate) O-methyltransferase [Chitinophagaceae bacterium]
MEKKYEDTYQHKGLRNKLVDGLRKKGITDEAVLAAINNIPRHYFLDSAFDKIAYEDRAFPIGEGQTISQPYTVAYQTQLLQVKMSDKILEVGTGSAYQATVLAEMGARVYTIERQKKLFDFRQKNYQFKDKYPYINFVYGDGFAGLPKVAPFDKIIVTAAAPYIPSRLIEQLKVGGMMVIPVDDNTGGQRMLRLTRRADGGYDEEAFEHFSFVPMLSGRKS